MKILKLIALTLALAVSAIAQVNLSQPPGTYTNNSIPVRDGTGNKIKNADLLRYDGSGGNSTFRVGDTAYTINSNGYIETYASTTASLGAFVPGSRFQPWVTTSGFTIYGYRSGDAYSVMDYISSPNTLEITPNLILPASFIRPPTNVTITEASPDTGTFNIALANETATIDEATTLAFSANGAAGQKFTGKIANASGGPLVVTLTNCTPSSTIVAPGVTQEYAFESTGSAWVMRGGDPYATAGQIVFIIDGGGSAISTGSQKAAVTMSRSGSITGWTILGNESGSIVLDIWKDTYANYPPVVADTITASAKPTLTAATKATSTTLTGWTTYFSAGDVFKVNVDSITTSTYVTLILNVTY